MHRRVHRKSSRFRAQRSHVTCEWVPHYRQAEDELRDTVRSPQAGTELAEQ